MSRAESKERLQKYVIDTLVMNTILAKEGWLLPKEHFEPRLSLELKTKEEMIGIARELVKQLTVWKPGERRWVCTVGGYDYNGEVC